MIMTARKAINGHDACTGIVCTNDPSGCNCLTTRNGRAQTARGSVTTNDRAVTDNGRTTTLTTTFWLCNLAVGVPNDLAGRTRRNNGMTRRGLTVKPGLTTIGNPSEMNRGMMSTPSIAVTPWRWGNTKERTRSRTAPISLAEGGRTVPLSFTFLTTWTPTGR